MADLDRCPTCGAERPADAPQGLCPRCLMRIALGEDAPFDVDPGATALLTSPGATELGREASRGRILGPAGGSPTVTGESGAAGEPTEDAGGPAHAEGTRGVAAGLPRGATIGYFGDFEIRGELGRGGMGVVYEARQISLNRPVALKMVRAGLLAGDDELRRFQNEAEAVALLDHPGVVPVYEVGEHEGQRYFSMKLVPGGSLVPLLDRYKGDPRAAAALAAEVAEAVAHAHMRGILHRDLKPANILIDEEGRPHVTDFGLAKRVEADAELTQSGAILGTPAFMAPEQAAGRRGGITTATDVYGLGSVLYALLTGKAPFAGESVFETLDAVRTRPPEPPTRLNARVPADLETICLKCLEKDPRRRYSTAQAVADDLRAWLGSRPIAARRVGPAERAWLWCRRRPAVAALAAAAATAIVGGVAAVIVVQAKANRVLESKNTELTEALGREAEANARVEQRYALAVDAIGTFHTGVSEDFLLKQGQFKDLRDRLLRSASDFYGKLGALLGEETDPASRRAVARANFELAELTAKVGRTEEALAAHRAVLARREALAADPETKADVGRSLTAVASLLAATGRGDEAETTFRRAEALLADLMRSSSPQAAAKAALADCRSRLGRLLAARGRTADALEAYRLARADQEAAAAVPGAPADARRELADTVQAVARLLALRRKADGEVEYRTALRLYQSLADEYPAVTEYRSRLAGVHHELSAAVLNQARGDESAAEMRAAMALYRGLAEENPAVTEYRGQMALGHYSLGNIMEYSGRSAAGEAEYREALGIYRRLVAEHPTVTEHRSMLSATLTNLGDLLRQAGRPTEAESACREAVAIARVQADEHPADLQLRYYIAFADDILGGLLLETGRAPEAGDVFREALGISQRLADDDPTDVRHRRDVAWTVSRLARVQWHEGRASEAVASLRKAIGIHERPDSPSYTLTPVSFYSFACYHALLAGLAADPGSGLTAAEGRAEADRAMDHLRRAVAGGLRDPGMYRTDSALKALRDRADFRLLMMDLAMPADPFAP